MKPTSRHSITGPAWTVLIIAAWLFGCAHAPMELAQPAPLKPGAVIYGVVPPLFGQDPLNDVTERLDYLRDLGVDAILLSPINATDDLSSISYSVIDYFTIRPDFGDMADLKRLTREAERRGLKIMMDFVPNHTSTAHPFYLDIQKHGRDSLFYDYYDRDASGDITHYFDWVGLPNLNYDNPDVVSLMTRAFAYWVRTAGIDGYRVDVAWGIRQRAPQVWQPLIRELRSIDPAVVMLAEAGARDPFYIENGFDLAYDWTEDLGQWAWKPVFERIFRAGPLLHDALTKNQDAPQTVLRFLNNNDTGPRFISRYGLEVTRVAAVLQHTVPGVPLVYTGDEFGAAYEPYEDRPPLSWEDDPHDLRGLYRRLAELREALPAIHSGEFVSLPPVAKTSAAYAFIRFADRENWALVLINFDLAEQITLRLPEALANLVDGAHLKDELGGARHRPSVDADGMLTLHLNDYAAMILTPEG